MSLNSSCAMASSILIPLIWREPAMEKMFETFFANATTHRHPRPFCYLIKSSIISIICQQHHASWRIVLTVQTSISPFLPGTTSCLCYTWSAFCCGGPPAAEKEAQVKGNVETCRHAILERLNVVVNHIFNHKKDSLLASLVPPPAEEDTLSSSSSPSSYLPEKHWCGDMRAAEDQQAIVTCRNMEKEMSVSQLH